MNAHSLILGIYLCAVSGLAIYGFNALIMTLLFGIHRRQGTSSSVPPDEWPYVAIQLPIYNERLVVRRLIDACAQLDYPSDRIMIQVLDDSTDETKTIARSQVAYQQERGVNISYHHRDKRDGFKAGALSAAMSQTTAEFVVIFDADFLPDKSYLKDVIPKFSDPDVGMVQTRWGHLNDTHSILTRSQAIALDGHFIVEQTVRSRSNLFFNFNGSAGIWRRKCIEESGGWHADTVAEDLDLSYRAQLLGWKMCYLPSVICLGELPVDLQAFKQQQFRWAKGSVQCLLKHGLDVVTKPGNLWRRLQGLMHLGGYIAHPLILLLLLSSSALIHNGPIFLLPWGMLSVAGMGPPILYAVSQMTTYQDGWRRYLYLPFLVLLGLGISVNNTWAVIEALVGRNPTLFLRTPKTSSIGPYSLGTETQPYILSSDWTNWAELGFGLYSLITALAAFEHNPGMAPFLLLLAIAFFYTAALGLQQSSHVRHNRHWNTLETGD